MQLHLAAYRARSDVAAVVHAHPPFATAMGLAGRPLSPSIPEAVVSIGDVIPVAPFAMPGAKENEDIVSGILGETDVFMMQGNGVLSVGTDLEQAYLRLELVEHVAMIQHLAAQMGKPLALAPGDLAELLRKRASIGLGPRGGGERAAAPLPGGSSADIDCIRDAIVEEIRKVLKGS
jgi:L-fuculose-phosphate aldolase